MSNDLTIETPERPYEIIVKCKIQGTDMHIHRFVSEEAARIITQAILRDEPRC